MKTHVSGRRIRLAAAAAAVLLLCAVVCLSRPRRRIEQFVSLHGEQLEDCILAGDDIPEELGIQAVNRWESTHPMTELLLFTFAGTYYGCYYSPDGLPLAFQNTPVELVDDGAGNWNWSAQGDNHGATFSIRGNWYGFEASF